VSVCLCKHIDVGNYLIDLKFAVYGVNRHTWVLKWLHMMPKLSLVNFQRNLAFFERLVH